MHIVVPKVTSSKGEDFRQKDYGFDTDKMKNFAHWDSSEEDKEKGWPEVMVKVVMKEKSPDGRHKWFWVAMGMQEFADRANGKS